MSQSDKETVDFEIANWLALEDLAKLIEINRDRICVFNEGTATVDGLSMLNPVIMNGTSIQITVNDDLDEPIKL